MASQIHFKLKRDKNFDSITFSGMSMRLIDLKLAIAEKKYGNSRGDFDLVVEHAQRNEAYMRDNDLVPKNTQVIVKMVEAKGKGLLQSLPRKLHQVPPSGQMESQEVNNFGTDKVSQNLSNVSRVASSQPVFDFSRSGKGFGKGKGGPSNLAGSTTGIEGDERRILKGVPMKFQAFTEEGNVSMLANNEKFLHNRDKASDATTLKSSKSGIDYGDDLPDQFRCPLCKLPMVDAVVLKWAQRSACDGCIRSAMRQKEGVCPLTEAKVNRWQDQLIPNKALRGEIVKFEQQYAAGQYQKVCQERDEQAAKQGLASKDENNVEADMSNLTPRPEGVDAQLDLGGLGAGLYDDFEDDECVDYSNSVQDAKPILPIQVQAETKFVETEAVPSVSPPTVAEEVQVPPTIPGPRPPPGPPPPHVLKQREEERHRMLQLQDAPGEWNGNQKRHKGDGLCRDFQKGRCSRGVGCMYRHEDVPLSLYEGASLQYSDPQLRHDQDEDKHSASQRSNPNLGTGTPSDMSAGPEQTGQYNYREIFDRYGKGKGQNFRQYDQRGKGQTSDWNNRYQHGYGGGGKSGSWERNRHGDQRVGSEGDRHRRNWDRGAEDNRGYSRGSKRSRSQERTR